MGAALQADEGNAHDEDLVTLDMLQGKGGGMVLGSWIVIRGWGAVGGMVAMTAVVVWGGMSLCWTCLGRRSRVETLDIRDAD